MQDGFSWWWWLFCVWWGGFGVFLFVCLVLFCLGFFLLFATLVEILLVFGFVFTWFYSLRIPPQIELHPSTRMADRVDQMHRKCRPVYQHMLLLTEFVPVWNHFKIKSSASSRTETCRSVIQAFIGWCQPHFMWR